MLNQERINLRHFAAAIVVIVALGHHVNAQETPTSLIKLGNGSYHSTTALVVDKARRILSVWSNTNKGLKKVAEYQSDLGRKEGPKSTRGDFKTPEGIYFLQTMLEGAELSFNEYGMRAFTTNYPNLFDRRDGKTGDGIWLHAVPDTVSLERGSRGCVVLRNDAIKEVTQYIKLGATPIIISDTVNTVDAAKTKAEETALTALIESWRKSWEAKDIASYIQYYDENFESLKMNKDQWKEYKDTLNSKYEKISVSFSDPVIYKYHDKIVVRALQSYNSDKHQDFGEKILYLVEKGPLQYKIIGEEWAAVPNAEAFQATMNLRSTATAN